MTLTVFDGVTGARLEAPSIASLDYQSHIADDILDDQKDIQDD